LLDFTLGRRALDARDLPEAAVEARVDVVDAEDATGVHVALHLDAHVVHLDAHGERVLRQHDLLAEREPREKVLQRSRTAVLAAGHRRGFVGLELEVARGPAAVVVLDEFGLHAVLAGRHAVGVRERLELLPDGLLQVPVEWHTPTRDHWRMNVRAGAQTVLNGDDRPEVVNDDLSRRALAAVFPAGLPNRALAVLGVGLFGMGLAVGSYGAAVTRLLERGVAPGVAGLGMTLFLLGQLVVVAPADRLTRTRRSALVATVGLLAGAAAVALSATGSVGTTLAARGLLGIGQGAAFVGAMKHVGRRTPGDLVATAQGLLGALFTLGLAVALAVASAAFEYVGVQAAMLAVAVVVAVGAAGAPFLDRGQSEPVVPLRAYLAPLRSQVGLALGLGNMATFGFLIVATTWYVDALEGVPGVPATATLLAFAATTVVGRALGGMLAARMGERAVVRWSLLGLAAALAGMAAGVHYDAPALLVVAVAGTGFGFSVPFGPLFALAFSNLADDAGVTLVVMLAVGNAGALAYPWLVGELVAATATYATGFAAMSVTVVGIWALWRRAIGGAPEVTLAD